MRCFTVLGPSQSGKTTLVQALTELEGRAEPHSLSDSFSLSTFDYIGERWGAFDIAGGTDHLGTAGQALAASDAAVLCVSPDPEAAPLAAPYLRLIEESGVPCFLFINRMDVAEGRVRDMVAALQTYSAHPIVLRQVPIREGDTVVGAVDLISERAWEYKEGEPSALIELPDTVADREQEARTELLEHLADFNDDLLEQLIEDKIPATDSVYSLMADVHRDNAVVAAYLGAASHMNGVNRLMKSLRHEAPDVSLLPDRVGLDGALAIGLLGENRKHVGKSVLIRALGGGVKHGAALGGDGLGNLTDPEGNAINDALSPGDLALAVKSDHLDAGKAYTADASLDLPDWTRGPAPAFHRVLTPKSDRDDARLSTALQRLASIDPGLQLGQDEDSGHIVASLQSPMHLRRVQAKLEEDFGVGVEAESLNGSYRETISRSVDEHYRHRKQSGGAGQFADVHMTVRPLPRGGGFTFDETVKGGAVPRNYIPAVGHGAEDALARGPLGFKVVDVGVTLTDGKHHSVDSSDFAFRMAGSMGVKEALKKAGPVLLQPIDQVEIHVPSIYAGSLVAVVSSLKGQVQGFDPHPTAKGWDVFRALVPSPMLDELFQSLGGLTHGTAWMGARFDHYEEIHGKEAEKIQSERAEALA